MSSAASGDERASSCFVLVAGAEGKAGVGGIWNERGDLERLDARPGHA